MRLSGNFGYIEVGGHTMDTKSWQISVEDGGGLKTAKVVVYAGDMKRMRPSEMEGKKVKLCVTCPDGRKFSFASLVSGAYKTGSGELGIDVRGRMLP